MKATTPLLDRILARVDADASCWVWTGARSEGYGTVGRGRRGEGNVSTHRALWELLVGPIGEGLDLDHLCRNRACCNPDHLEPVDRVTNVARGARRPGYRDEVAHCKRGHLYDRFTPKQRICRTCKNDLARALRLERRRSAA